MKTPLTHRYDLVVESDQMLLGQMQGVLYDTIYLAFPAIVFDALPAMDSDFKARVYDPFETVKDIMDALMQEDIYSYWWKLDEENVVNIHGVNFSLIKVFGG